MTASIARLPSHPRPKLVSDEPAVKPKNEFAIVGRDVREAAGDVRALAERINRALSGPYCTTASLDAAEYHAGELADVANALAKAIKRSRQ